MRLFLSMLALLFPLAIYLLVLAAINRRSRPTMVRGVWDCAGMLIAGIGFFLVAIPLVFQEILERDMGLLVLEKGAFSFRDIYLRQVSLWAGYYAVLFLFCCLLVWLRRGRTVIYNVDPEMLGHVLTGTLEGMGLTHTERGSRWRVERHQGAQPLQGQVERTEKAADLGIIRFGAMKNVELAWRDTQPQVRTEIEERLAENLERARTLENPAASWLFALACILFGTMFVMLFIMLVLATITAGR